MPKYRNHLPQLGGDFFATDGELDVTVMFTEGRQVPRFAIFDLINDSDGRAALRRYFSLYADMALTHGIGFILESPAWQSHLSGGHANGQSPATLMAANKGAIGLLAEIRTRYETDQSKMVISGTIAPRGSRYAPLTRMTVSEAVQYHALQVMAFSETAADMITAVSMHYIEEVIGIVHAAAAVKMPIVVSLAVGENGRLASGQLLASAIRQIDAVTQHGPAYYMVDCANPALVEQILPRDEAWVQRIRGVRAGDFATTSDYFNEFQSIPPLEWGRQHHSLRRQFPHFNVFGGCCGTKWHYIDAICHACVPLQQAIG